MLGAVLATILFAFSAVSGARVAKLMGGTEANFWRLSLATLFLATLAHLGDKRLIQISRSKSNGDYVRELGWRSRGRDGLSESFHQQVRTFDRVWYGWHDATPDLLTGFEAQHERITTNRSCQLITQSLTFTSEDQRRQAG